MSEKDNLNGDTPNNTDELSSQQIIVNLKKYYRFLKKRRWKIYLTGFIFAMLGLTVALVKKPKYIARATFVLQDEGEKNLSSLASQFGLGGGGATGKTLYSGYNFAPFITSRLMIQKTLFTKSEFKYGSELLLNHYIKANEYDKKWNKSKKLKNISFTTDSNLTRAQDSILNIFYQKLSYGGLKVDRWDKKSTIILLEFVDKDEEFAKNFLIALANNAMQYYVDFKTKKANASVSKLQAQADSIKSKLDRALSSVAYSTDATPNANPMRQSLKIAPQRKMVDVEVYSKALVEINKNLELAKISLTQDTPLIEFLDKPIMPLKVKKYGKVISTIGGFILGMFFSIGYLTSKRLLFKLKQI